jgi:hypothetical protein
MAIGEETQSGAFDIIIIKDCNHSGSLIIKKPDSSCLHVRSWFFDNQGGSE